MATRIVDRVSAESHVLAPVQVSSWLSVQSEHPLPLVVRHMYLKWATPQLGKEEVKRRRYLLRLVSRPSNLAHAADHLRKAVQHYPLDAVCLHRSAVTPDFRAALTAEELRQTFHSPNYELWSRPRQTVLSTPGR